MWPHLMAIFFITFSRGLGEAKTLAVMTGAHPPPPARESILLFWTFNRFLPYYGFNRAIHVIQLSGTALLWIR